MLLSTSLQFFSALSVVSTTSPYLHNQSTSNRSSTLLHSSYPCYFFSISVTFKWNTLLDLSREAATKAFGSLVTEFLLQVLGESTGTMTIGMIHDGEGMGDIPGIRGVQGVCRFCATKTRLTQELRLKV